MEMKCPIRQEGQMAHDHNSAVADHTSAGLNQTRQNDPKVQAICSCNTSLGAIQCFKAQVKIRTGNLDLVRARRDASEPSHRAALLSRFRASGTQVSCDTTSYRSPRGRRECTIGAESSGTRCST